MGRGGGGGVRVSDGQPKENKETHRYRDLHEKKWREPRPMVSCGGVCVSVGQSNKIKKKRQIDRNRQRERPPWENMAGKPRLFVGSGGGARGVGRGGRRREYVCQAVNQIKKRRDRERETFMR